MSDVLFSTSWYKVAQLRPRLRAHAQIHRHIYRGKEWYVVQDHSTGGFHRFSSEAYRVIGLMDGTHTLQQIWDTACAQLGDDMPTQDEVINLLSVLHTANVLQSDIPPDINDLERRGAKKRQNKILKYLKSPMAMQFSLFDPDRFLDRTYHTVAPLFGRAAAVLWSFVVLVGAVLAVLHWKELANNVTDQLLSMENVFVIWLIYPVVKTLHEFSHAYMIKRWNGGVHEMGVMLLVLTPVPYVDASSSTAFPDKRKRMLVGAAGIMAELLLAAIALIIWVNVQPGAVRATAFNVIMICGVSTLLFNGNPLLRYDGYYILSDLLEIPNLGTRGTKYIIYLIERYLFKIESRSPAKSPGECAWLFAHSIASFIYRIFISVNIIIFIAGKYFIIGILLAIAMAAGMLVIPFFKIVRYLFTDARLQQKKKRMTIVVTSVTVLAILGLFVIPAPMFTVAEGVIWVPDEAQVYASAEGVIQEVVAEPGEQVSRGEILIRCENQELFTKADVLGAELRVLEAQLREQSTKDRNKTRIIHDEINRASHELAMTREQIKGLEVRSPADGIFLIAQAVDVPGRYVRRGDSLAYVAEFSELSVRVVLPQADVTLVQNDTRGVAVRLGEAIDTSYPAFIRREIPAASQELPSLALSTEGGGRYALDPRGSPVAGKELQKESRDSKGKNEPKALEKLFHFEIQLDGIPLNKVGERVFVRFTHTPEPLGFRFYRTIRRLFLKRFEV